MRKLKQIFPKISVPVVFAFFILLDIFFWIKRWFYEVPEKIDPKPIPTLETVLLYLATAGVIYALVAEFFLWFTRKAEKQQKIYLWIFLGLQVVAGILSYFGIYHPLTKWVFFGLAVIFLVLSLKAAKHSEAVPGGGSPEGAAKFDSSELPQS